MLTEVESNMNDLDSEYQHHQGALAEEEEGEIDGEEGDRPIVGSLIFAFCDASPSTSAPRDSHLLPVSFSFLGSCLLA